LNDGKRDDLIYLLKANNVVIVASFPSLNLAQAEAQRGEGIFKVSVDAVRRLNRTRLWSEKYRSGAYFGV
jgi:hypothetical protein